MTIWWVTTEKRHLSGMKEQARALEDLGSVTQKAALISLITGEKLLPLSLTAFRCRNPERVFFASSWVLHSLLNPPHVSEGSRCCD